MDKNRLPAGQGAVATSLQQLLPLTNGYLGHQEFSTFKRSPIPRCYMILPPPRIKQWIKIPWAPNNSMRATRWQDQRGRTKSYCLCTWLIDKRHKKFIGCCVPLGWSGGSIGVSSIGQRGQSAEKPELRRYDWLWEEDGEKNHLETNRSKYGLPLIILNH